MAGALLPPVGDPAGFPNCSRCPYLSGGSARVCFDCANKTIEQIPGQSCPVCSQLLDELGQCPNWLCDDPDRKIRRISAIAYSSGALRRKILDYKYENRWGWAAIFGRLVVGWLERNVAPGEEPDLILANPTYVDPAVTSRKGHTERVLEAAEREDTLGRWPIDVADPRVLVKTRPTARSANNSAPAKRAAAAELRSALVLSDPARVRGKTILVYDDVCTTASQLDAIAGFLITRGAAAVDGLVLARAPWR